MSATRDSSQKIAFVYSNLYRIYRKGQDAAAKATPVPPPPPKKAMNPQAEAYESLKENLRTLNSLHTRLRGMIIELEELVRD